MFGVLPAYGFYIHHAKGVELNNVEVSYLNEDRRSAFVLEDVTGADFFRVKAQQAEGVPIFSLKNVANFSVQQSWPVSDARLECVEQKKL